MARRTFSSVSIPKTNRFDIYEDTPDLDAPFGRTRLVESNLTQKQMEAFFDKQRAEALEEEGKTSE